MVTDVISNLYATLTMNNSVTVLNEVTRIMKSEIEYYRNDSFFQYASILLQPLPRLFTDRSIEFGGNVLGLDRYEDDNIIYLLNLAWNGTQFDAKAHSLADKVMGDVTTYLESVNALKDFQYINCKRVSGQIVPSRPKERLC